MKSNFTQILMISVLITFFAAGFTSAQQGENSLENLYQKYLLLKDALAQDNTASAAQAAEDLAKAVPTKGFQALQANLIQLKKKAEAIATSNNIKTQRAHFYAVSDEMIIIAGKSILSRDDIFVQYCPMAKGHWLSDSKKIVNPYYGSEMLACGYIKEEIKR